MGRHRPSGVGDEPTSAVLEAQVVFRGYSCRFWLLSGSAVELP